MFPDLFYENGAVMHGERPFVVFKSRTCSLRHHIFLCHLKNGCLKISIYMALVEDEIKTKPVHLEINRFFIVVYLMMAFDVRSSWRKNFFFLFLLKPTCSAFNSLVVHQYFYEMKFQLSFKVLSNASHVCLTTSTLRMSYQADFKTIYWCHMNIPAPCDSDDRPLFQTWRSGKHVTVDKIKPTAGRASQARLGWFLHTALNCVLLWGRSFSVKFGSWERHAGNRTLSCYINSALKSN